mmetsp:Transcript_120200/g.383758  ORF Transcript_120200/g.383758 Transcript_120200/m.383758 type:complete len:85 (+) Transcript_120200:163-417(+)
MTELTAGQTGSGMLLSDNSSECPDYVPDELTVLNSHMETMGQAEVQSENKLHAQALCKCHQPKCLRCKMELSFLFGDLAARGQP